MGARCQGAHVQVFESKFLAQFSSVRRLLRRSNDTPDRDRGRAALREGRVDEAIEAFKRHLRLRPRDGQSWVRLGNAYKDAGHYEQAKTAYERGCVLRPKSPHAWLQRGYLAKFTGDKIRAASCFRKSFELDGNAEAGRELLRVSEGDVIGLSPPSLVGCVDGITANSIFGWAVDPDSPADPVDIEFVQSGRVVGSGRTSLARPDVFSAGYRSTHAGFRVALNGDYTPHSGLVAARLVKSKRQLANSPYQPPEDDHVSRWVKRWDGLDAERQAELCEAMDGETNGMLLSIIMPVHNPNIEWLVQAVASVQGQFCSRWQLICVDDASSDYRVAETIKGFAEGDSRIKYSRSEENVGISGATNFGIDKASGEYVAFMDHDDLLEPEAVYRVLVEAKNKTDIIYSDEIITGENVDDIIEVVCRPAFSYDYYISHPYFVHFVAVKRVLATGVGGLDPCMTISMDVDFLLRLIERAESVAHIPSPLYRWRTHPGSVGHAKMDAVMSATKGALQRHHARIGRNAVVSDGLTFNTFRHDFSSTARVLVIVPTKDRIDLLKPCVNSILDTTSADILIMDHDSVDPDVIKFFDTLPDRVRVVKFSGPFNFSKINNDAVQTAGGDYDAYLFANNDIEAIEPGWLDHMSGLCMREDVGAVGALLLYSDGSIQHGGVVMNVGGPAEHVYKNAPSRLGGGRHPGYISGLVSVRDYMAVTGACLMVRADVFERVGGFDPLLAVGFNDIDLCLRVRERGYKVLYDGHAVLFHHESATRMTSKQLRHPEDTALMTARWADLLSGSDPYFSPMFGNKAPAEHVVANPIDPFAPARVWTKARQHNEGRGVSRTPPAVRVL